MKHAGCPRSEQGVALLLMLFLLIGGATTFFLYTWNGKQLAIEHDQKTEKNLQQAKDAVIAWSVSRAGPGSTGHPFPGQLPCPEDTSLIGQPNEGQAANCSNNSIQIGRIAWRTLGLVNPTDSSGEQLWYILSPSFRTLPSSPIATGVPTGQLELDGIANSATVIIIAPGPPLTSQNRPSVSSTSIPAPSNYLDQGNSSSSSFVSKGLPQVFNDRVITITSQELFQNIQMRVLSEIRGSFGANTGLLRYFGENGEFPVTGTPLNSLVFDTITNDWLVANGWFNLVVYTRISTNKAQLSIGNKLLNVTP